MVITVRHNRKTVAISGAQTSKLALSVTTLAAYESLTGNLNKNRIVQIQYVAIDQVVTTEFYWGTQPLQSKDVDDTCTPTTAGLSNPMMIDRWSYDNSMALLITQSNTQNYYFEIVEYEIVAYTGTPPRPYTQIMSNGQAMEIETAAQETAASTLKLKP